jgi:hypothetical protein
MTKGDSTIENMKAPWPTSLSNLEGSSLLQEGERSVCPRLEMYPKWSLIRHVPAHLLPHCYHKSRLDTSSSNAMSQAGLFFPQISPFSPQTKSNPAQWDPPGESPVKDRWPVVPAGPISSSSAAVRKMRSSVTSSLTAQFAFGAIDTQEWDSGRGPPLPQLDSAHHHDRPRMATDGEDTLPRRIP